MRENNLRRVWTDGGAVVNGWLGIPSAVSAENMAQAGWDSLTIDMQHGLVDFQAAVAMFQAVQTTPTTPIVRVPWNEPGIIGKVLDAGAMGVICPMVNTGEDAAALVRACRYPPAGTRSFGPTRAIWTNGPDYWREANDSVVVLAMIETREAVANLDAILSVKSLDGVYIGPADLGLTHGLVPKGDRDEPEMLAVIEQILEGCKRHRVHAGIHCQAPAYARRMISEGFDFVTIAADNALLGAAAKAAVDATRGDGGAAGGGLY